MAAKHDPHGGREERFLMAARRLFLEQGYDAVTIDAVIALSGGSKATLYARFGGKEGLFRALMEDAVRDIVAPSALPSGREDPREVLEGFGLTLSRRVLSAEIIGLYRLAVSAAARFPDLGQLFFTVGPRAARERLTTYLRAASEAGRLSVNRPEEACDFFMGMLLERSLVAQSLGLEGPPSEADLKARTGAAVDVFLAAYGGPGRKAGGA